MKRKQFTTYNLLSHFISCYTVDYITHRSFPMPRTSKKTSEKAEQPLPKPTPPPPPGPQQQIQCKIHTNTHAVLLGLGALVLVSFGLSWNALAAKSSNTTLTTLATDIVFLQTKIDGLQKKLDAYQIAAPKVCAETALSLLLNKEQQGPEMNETKEGSESLPSSQE